MWLPDALRGLALLNMLAYHAMYDWVYVFAHASSWYDIWSPGCHLWQQYICWSFILLSGFSFPLARRPVRNGLLVAACAALLTAATVLFLPSESIWFGVLHLLGICMMIYPLFRKLPTAPLAALALCIILIGYAITGLRVSAPFLFPLGLVTDHFFSSDYFPIFPQLGWFLLGVVLGRTVYAEKRTLLPGNAQNFFLLRFFCWCGRQSLFIYLLHQPILYGLLELLAALNS